MGGAADKCPVCRCVVEKKVCAPSGIRCEMGLIGYSWLSLGDERVVVGEMVAWLDWLGGKKSCEF